MSKSIELIARGLAVVSDHYLLCRAAKGYYYLPGGHVEFGESVANALAREFAEEAGLRVSVDGVLACSENVFVQGGKQRHELNIVLHVELPHCRVEDGIPETISSREEGIGFEWLRMTHLDSIDLRPETLRGWLLRGHPAGAWMVDATDG